MLHISSQLRWRQQGQQPASQPASQKPRLILLSLFVIGLLRRFPDGGSICKEEEASKVTKGNA
jgi:hypothetical protein